METCTKDWAACDFRSYGPVIGWFVPIWNLFRPYEVVQDLFVRTNEHAFGSNSPQEHLSLSSVNLWWAFYISSILTARLSEALAQISNPETGEEVRTFLLILLIADILNIAFYYYAKKVAKEYSKVEAPFE